MMTCRATQPHLERQRTSKHGTANKCRMENVSRHHLSKFRILLGTSQLPPPCHLSFHTQRVHLGSAVGSSSITAVDSVHVRNVSPNEDDAPPAKRARKFSDADQASAHQTMAHVSSLCLVRHHWHANIVGFSHAPCKESPCAWSGICRTSKWRLASFHSQCIAAQICTVYDMNSQKDKGRCSIPLPC